MAPVYAALARTPGLSPHILSTGQQRQMLDGALAVFGLTPDRYLNVMTDRQTLADLTARIVPQAGRTLRDLVLAQVSDVLATALTASWFAVLVGRCAED